MRQVGVHGHEVRGRGGCETREERSAVSPLLLDHHASPSPFRGRACAIVRPGVGYHNLYCKIEPGNHFLQGREQELQIFSLVPGRNDNRDVRCNAVRGHERLHGYQLLKLGVYGLRSKQARLYQEASRSRQSKVNLNEVFWNN